MGLNLKPLDSPGHRDGTNALKAELRTAQLREEELRAQLEAKEKALEEAQARLSAAHRIFTDIRPNPNLNKPHSLKGNFCCSSRIYASSERVKHLMCEHRAPAQ